MRRQLTTALAIMSMVLALASTAYAVTVTPDLIAVPVSPSFGPVVAGGQVTDQYKGFGVIFSDGVATAIFSDPPLAFGGVNESGTVDLLSPVNGYFVIPGSTSLASRSFLSVEAGFAIEGSLLLQVFDVNRVLLGSTPNDDGLGPHGRTLLTLSVPDMVYFSVSGSDTFGVNQLEFDGQLGAVPEPGTLLLFGSTLIGLAGYGRMRFLKK